ncbi:MAG: S9 family peptidase [Candidatus Heimdallarchaeota archaeon]|nr:S9 family peptidase [Candidatus Heimdallarchaeota archaeon]
MNSKFTYPKTEKQPFKEQIHGVTISDPYRWLENTDDPKVQSWIEAQNNFTENILKEVKGREKIKEKVKTLYQYNFITNLRETEIGCYYIKKMKDKKQPVLFFSSFNEPDKEIKIIDVEEEDPSGYTSLDYFFPSTDGKLIAYGTSSDGSELSTLYIKNVETGKELPDKIEEARYSFVIWKKDKSGFYYTRFPKKGEVEDGEETFHSHVRYHQLGTPPDEDPVIFKSKVPQEYPSMFLSPDETYMITTSHRFIACDVFFIDLTAETIIVSDVVTNSEWMIFPCINSQHIYFLSNHEHSNFAVYRTTNDNLSMDLWECIIPPSDNGVIHEIQVTETQIVVCWLTNVVNNIKIYDLNGKIKQEVPIPENGTVGNMIVRIRSRLKSDTIYFNFQTYYDPPTMYSYNMQTEDLSTFYTPEIPLNLSKYETKNAWYESKDGTNVHMFILQSKDTIYDGKNPTILHGYGGFGMALTPTFSPFMIQWLEMGGIMAIANLRGGCEFGVDWHRAGCLNKRQNVFDDFIAAAEYLVSNKYCTEANLGILGRSNGGLLVGAVTVQRPDLFNAVMCSVPLLDMLRYHKFLLGKTWVPEFGDPEKEEDFKWLYNYSPYHNVKENVAYPSIFFKAAIFDTRVDPSHAIKMTALLQEVSISDKPILLRVETKAGHGVGKPQDKQIEDDTDNLSYLSSRLIYP